MNRHHQSQSPDERDDGMTKDDDEPRQFRLLDDDRRTPNRRARTEGCL